MCDIGKLEAIDMGEEVGDRWFVWGICKMFVCFFDDCRGSVVCDFREMQ